MDGLSTWYNIRHIDDESNVIESILQEVKIINNKLNIINDKIITLTNIIDKIKVAKPPSNYKIKIIYKN